MDGIERLEMQIAQLEKTIGQVEAQFEGPSEVKKQIMDNLRFQLRVLKEELDKAKGGAEAE